MNWRVSLSQGLALFPAAFGPGAVGKVDPEIIAIVALSFCEVTRDDDGIVPRPAGV